MSSTVPTCHLGLQERAGMNDPRRPQGQDGHLPPLQALTRALKVAALAGVSEGTSTRGPGWTCHAALPAALLSPIGTGGGTWAPGTPL